MNINCEAKPNLQQLNHGHHLITQITVQTVFGNLAALGYASK